MVHHDQGSGGRIIYQHGPMNKFSIALMALSLIFPAQAQAGNTNVQAYNRCVQATANLQTAKKIKDIRFDQWLTYGLLDRRFLTRVKTADEFVERYEIQRDFYCKNIEASYDSP